MTNGNVCISHARWHFLEFVLYPLNRILFSTLQWQNFFLKLVRSISNGDFKKCSTLNLRPRPFSGSSTLPFSTITSEKTFPTVLSLHPRVLEYDFLLKSLSSESSAIAQKCYF